MAYGGGFMVEAMWWYDGRLCFVCVLCVCYLRGRRVDAQAHRLGRRDASSAAQQQLSGRRCVCDDKRRLGRVWAREKEGVCVAAVMEVRSAR